MATQNLELAGPIKRTIKGHENWYYGGGEEAYQDRASALASVPVPVRIGQTVGIYESGKIVEYWWNEVTTDEGLVLKVVDTTGGGTSTRFGVAGEDDLAAQNRYIDIAAHDFDISNASHIHLGASGSGASANLHIYDNAIDLSSFTSGQGTGGFQANATLAQISYNSTGSQKRVRINPNGIEFYQYNTTTDFDGIIRVPFVGAASTVTRYMPLSVNGIFANSNGNITLDLGSGGGGTLSRFGIEDNTTTVNREFDLGTHTLDIIKNNNEFYMGNGGISIGGYVQGVSFATVLAGEDNINLQVANQVNNSFKQLIINSDRISFANTVNGIAKTSISLPIDNPSNGEEEHFIPLSVNGTFADSTGNITLDLSGAGGGGSLSRFGIEDNLGVQDRFVDMVDHSFEMKNIPYSGAGFTVYAGDYNFVNPAALIGMSNGQVSLYSYSPNTDTESSVNAYPNTVQLHTTSLDGSAKMSFALTKDGLAMVKKVSANLFSYIFPTDISAPDDYYMPFTVNGTKADSTGNIILDLGSGGGGTALSLTTTGNSGASSYDSGTGVLNIPNYTYTLPTASASVLGGIKVGSGLTIDSSTGILSAVSAANLTLTTNGNRGASTLSNSVLNIPNYTYTAGTNINITTDNLVECNVIDWAISNGATSQMTAQVDYTSFGSGYGRKIVRWNGLANNSQYFALPDAATTFVEIIGNNATIGGAYENFSYYNIGTGHGITNVNLAITNAGGFLFNKAITVVNSTGNDITLSFNNRLAPLTNKYDNPPSQMLTSTLTLPAGHTIKLVSTIAYNNNEPGSSNFLRWIPAGIYPSRTIGSSGSSYTLPTASNTVLGGVKVGTGLSIDGSGVLSASGGAVTYHTQTEPATPAAGDMVEWFDGTAKRWKGSDGVVHTYTFSTP